MAKCLKDWGFNMMCFYMIIATVILIPIAFRSELRDPHPIEWIAILIAVLLIIKSLALYNISKGCV